MTTMRTGSLTVIRARGITDDRGYKGMQMKHREILSDGKIL